MTTHVEPVECRTKIIDENGAPCGELAHFVGNTGYGASMYMCPNDHKTFRTYAADQDDDTPLSDDPPGADSSPMSELQRNALAAAPAKRPTPTVESAPADVEQHIATAMSTWNRSEAIDRVVGVIATGIADAAVAGYSAGAPTLARYAYARKLQDDDRRAALAEHTQPAIEAIERASLPQCDCQLDPIPDPYAGIPNADDRDNQRF